MDKHTLSHYGLILISTMIIAAIIGILSPLTPFGDSVRTSINDAIDKYIDRTPIDEVDNPRDDIDPGTGGDVKKNVTINIIYESGTPVQDPIYITVNKGDTLNVEDYLPDIDGHHPTNIPKEQVITKDTDINVIYVPDAYTITFITNGGVITSSKPVSYTFKQHVVLPTKVEKQGYTFVGWYDNPQLEGQRKTEIKPSEKGDKTFYAKWTNKAYNITYMDGNKNITSTIDEQYRIAIYGESTILPVMPAKNGLTFAGWYDNKYLQGVPVTETEKDVSEDLTYYAKYTDNEYTITYVTNGGNFTGGHPTSYKHGQVVKLPTNIEREGYNFLGWYTSPSFTTKVTEIPADAAENKTYYANWEYRTYNITYDLNGGTMHGSSISQYTYNPTKDSEPFNQNVTKAGWVFVGWKDLETGIIERYVAAGRTGDIVLQAQFARQTFYVTYDSNGGTPAIQKVPVRYGSPYGTPPLVSREGYTLEGWYTTKDNSGVKVSNTDTYLLEKDQTLYAHWTPNVYDIIYVTDGGTFATAPTKKYTYGVGLNPIPTNITREHYTFDGWYTDGNFTQKITNISTTQTNNVYLYAKWIPDVYNITYDTNGGTISGNDYDTKYTYGIGTDELPTPTKGAFIFVGWADITNGNDNYDNFITTDGFSTTDYGNRVLKAIWKEPDLNLTIKLVDENGKPIQKDGQNLEYVLDSIAYDELYSYDPDYFTGYFGINDTYYHPKFEFKYTRQEGIDNGFVMSINLVCYKYRVLNLRFYLNGEDITDEPGSLDGTPFNYVYKFKQPKHETADIEIPSTINSNGFEYVLEKTNLNGKTIEQFIQAGNKTLEVYYKNREFTITYNFNPQQVQNFKINYDKSKYPTKYNYNKDYNYSFTIPYPNTECYVIENIPGSNCIVKLNGDNTATITSKGAYNIVVNFNWMTDPYDGNHTYNKVKTQSATCTKTENWTYTCTTCHNVKYITNPALGHNFTGAYKSAGSDGHYRKCSDCSSYGTGTRASENAVVNKTTSHSMSSKVTKNATCTATGTRNHYCTYCSYNYNSTIQKLGHSLGSWYRYKNPTCTSAGSDRRDCSRCSHYESRRVNALGHSYDTETVNATCTKAGYTRTYCTRCGHESSRTTIAKTGHSFTRACNTTHRPSGYTIAKTGWSCPSCKKRGSIGKVRHVMCKYCEGNVGFRACDEHRDKTYFQSYGTCRCASSHGSKWRCSNKWCRQYYKDGVFKLKPAW